jgi:hypothetical protein
MVESNSKEFGAMTIKSQIIDALTANPEITPEKIWDTDPKFRDVAWSYFRQVVREHRSKVKFDAEMARRAARKELFDSLPQNPDPRVEVIARAIWKYNSGGRDTWTDRIYGPSGDERARGLQAARESVEALIEAGMIPPAEYL